MTAPPGPRSCCGSAPRAGVERQAERATRPRSSTAGRSSHRCTACRPAVSSGSSRPKPRFDDAFELGRRRRDVADRNDRGGDEHVGPVQERLCQPVVVDLRARHLQIGRRDHVDEQPERRIDHLGDHAVERHVLQPRDRDRRRRRPCRSDATAWPHRSWRLRRRRVSLRSGMPSIAMTCQSPLCSSRGPRSRNPTGNRSCHSVTGSNTWLSALISARSGHNCLPRNSGTMPP